MADKTAVGHFTGKICLVNCIEQANAEAHPDMSLHINDQDVDPDDGTVDDTDALAVATGANDIVDVDKVDTANGGADLMFGLVIGAIIAALARFGFDQWRQNRSSNETHAIERRKTINGWWVGTAFLFWFVFIVIFGMWFTASGFEWWEISNWMTPEAEFQETDAQKIRETRVQELRNLLAALFFVVGGAAGAIQIGNSLHRTHLSQLEKDAGRDRLNADVFAKAAEQLGSDHVGTRIGAVYALENLARSDQERGGTFLTDQVMETLASFVRERSVAEIDAFEEAARQDPAEDPRFVPADIAAAVTALARSYPPDKRPVLSETADHAGRGGIDLKRSYLVGLRLYEGTDLTQFNLSGSYLQKSSLYGCKLDGVWLSGAKLQDARITKSSISGTFFTSTGWGTANGLSKPMLLSASWQVDDRPRVPLELKNVIEA